MTSHAVATAFSHPHSASGLGTREKLPGLAGLSHPADCAVHPVAKQSAHKGIDQDPEGIVSTVPSGKDKNQEPKQLVRNPKYHPLTPPVFAFQAWQSAAC